mmetsp:Transcript_14447/g.24651  ORF Transcript_14447/g.24651 Transcript_14447/m.24651 type:complete len:85 (+) Transcript_14447:413-667(+)
MKTGWREPGSSLADIWTLRKAQLIYNSRRFPNNFVLFCYFHFQGHLPEHLFLTEFKEQFHLSNKVTYRSFRKLFLQIDKTMEKE